MAVTQPERPQLLRILWRAARQLPTHLQIVTAATYKHTHSRELRVFLEPEEKGDLLMSEVARIDFTPLRDKAASLRDVLLEKGWPEVSAD